MDVEPGGVIRVRDAWHVRGGVPDAPHVAINGGGAPEWGAQVTDAEDEEGF